MSHIVTNWIGDDAQLVDLYTEVRRHNPEGDLLTIDGTVSGKRVADGRHLVDFELEARNQDGELSARSHATAALPARTRNTTK